MFALTLILWFYWCIFSVISVHNVEIRHANRTYEVDCNKLRMGQYICPDPKLIEIDLNTQQLKGCTKENVAPG